MNLITKNTGQSSLQNIFDRALERHPLTPEKKCEELVKCYNLYKEGKKEEEHLSLLKTIDSLKRQLFVQDLDKSKDKALFWTKRGVPRMNHQYNVYGYCSIGLTFEATVEMHQKLEKAYGILTENGVDKGKYIWYKNQKIQTLNSPASLAIIYRPFYGYFEASVNGYKLEFDSQVISILRNALGEIEKITSRVAIPQ